MTALKKPKPEVVWMAWSPRSNWLPQAASVSKLVCQEMIKERNWASDVKPRRAMVQAPLKTSKP
jgi:hypothetical protein